MIDDYFEKKKNFIRRKKQQTFFLLFCSTRAELFSPNKMPSSIFSIRNNCYEFFAYDVAVLKSSLQSYFKTLVCGISLLQKLYAWFLAEKF